MGDFTHRRVRLAASVVAPHWVQSHNALAPWSANGGRGGLRQSSWLVGGAGSSYGRSPTKRKRVGQRYRRMAISATSDKLDGMWNFKPFLR